MIEVRLIETSAELSAAHNIRTEVFVIEQECPEDIEWEFEEESTHYLALENNIPVGTSRWRYTADGIKMERFAVIKEMRGKNIGAALLLKMLSDTKQFNKTIYLHAQTHAAGFYEKYGFSAVGELFWEADIEHVKMKFTHY
jgi:predicted GNAT family N-acyltransferase